jgi:hypothetical protein
VSSRALYQMRPDGHVGTTWGQHPTFAKNRFTFA